MGQGQSGGAGFPGQAPGAEKKKEVRWQEWRWRLEREQRTTNELECIARAIDPSLCRARCLSMASAFSLCPSLFLLPLSLVRPVSALRHVSPGGSREAQRENEKDTKSRKQREAMQERVSLAVEARPLSFSTSTFLFPPLLFAQRLPPCINNT